MEKITPNELRIGNYVTIENDAWYDLKDVPLMVTQVKIHKDDMFPNSTGMITCCQLKDWKWDYSQFDEFIRPIPLTDEWLLKFGFKKEDKAPTKEHSNYFSMWWMDYKYSFSYAPFREDWGFYHSYTDACSDEDNNRFDFISCEIRYVHDLQNLLFGLTKTELVLQERWEKV